MPDREDLWAEYVVLRSGRNIDEDPDARTAHKFYVERLEEMNLGHESTNPYRFNHMPLSDGDPAEVSALQSFYNFVADKGLPSALAELQNDPPPDADESKLPVTSYHVQHNCRSGLMRGVVPENTVAITVGVDIKKLGAHHVTIAWSERAVGSIIDYDFYPFSTEGLKPAACEILILEGLQEWWKKRNDAPFCEAHGGEWTPDVVLIDSGWKDDGWNSQPVYLFARFAGDEIVIPSKGINNWRRKPSGSRCLSGDNFNLVVIDRGQRLAEVNPDHWKIRVHEGFLNPFGDPGSLGLFSPERDQWGREPANSHLKYSKEIVSERWGPNGPSRAWKWAPADGARIQKPNHYLDATALALCGRAMIGLSPVAAVTSEVVPVGAVANAAAADPQQFTPSYESSARSW